ncbi:hypothetical protein [Paraburkholderia strydomiana]
MNMKDAIVVIAFTRDRYFELVLESLIHQRIDGRPITHAYDLYIFQDGLPPDASDEARAGHAQIARIVSRLAVPHKYVVQPRNFGIAMHFDFIERMLFLERIHEHVLFFEDDLVLAPGYLNTIHLLKQKFAGDDRIGMFAANPGGPFISQSTQHENKASYLSMGHNWGFGLSRAFWQRRQPFVDHYLQFVKDIPYSKRDAKAISAWLERCGFNAGSSSQDYIKTCATAALGAARISTFPNFGLYIGREGVHCTPELFRRMGFDQSQIFDGELLQAGDLSDENFARIIDAQMKVHIKRPQEHDVETWQRRLHEGLMNPRAVALA